MIETRRLKNVVIFVQTILSFVLSRKIGFEFLLKPPKPYFGGSFGTFWAFLTQQPLLKLGFAFFLTL